MIMMIMLLGLMLLAMAVVPLLLASSLGWVEQEVEHHQ
jgi:hypothetical protein